MNNINVLNLTASKEEVEAVLSFVNEGKRRSTAKATITYELSLNDSKRFALGELSKKKMLNMIKEYDLHSDNVIELFIAMYLKVTFKNTISGIDFNYNNLTEKILLTITF